MMGQSEYGLYALVASVISYLTILDLGLGNALIRYTAKFRVEKSTKEQFEMFGMFLIVYVIIGIISLLGGLVLYYNVDNIFGETMTFVELAHARIMLLIMILNLAFTFPMSIFGNIMSAYERFVFPKTINLIRIILNTVLMVTLLHFGYKAIAMVVVQTVFNVISLILNYIYCKRMLHVKIYFGHFNFVFFKEIAIYSFWIYLNVIMDKIYWNTGQFVLGAVAGTIAISVFAVAIQLQGMYMQFSTAISSVFLPKITEMVTLHDSSNEISNLFLRIGRLQNVIMAFILFGFAVFGKKFVLLWAGPEYLDSYYITLLFFVALYVPLIQNIGITILQARNQLKFRSILYISISIISLIAQYYFSKFWGGIGCAIAIACALILGNGVILNIYYHVKQKIEIIQFWKEILLMDLIPILVSLVAIFILNFCSIYSWFQLGVAIFAYCAFYIPLFYFLSMNENERILFYRPFRLHILSRILSSNK